MIGRRVGVGVLVALLVGSAVAWAADPAPPRRWSITPPAGWRDVTADHPEEVRTVVDKLAAAGYTTQVAYYAGDGGLIQILAEVDGPAFKGPVRALLDGWENGAVRTLRGELKLADQAYERRADGNAFLVDHVATGPDGTLFMRRIAGVDGAGRIIAVAATCNGSEPVCTPALLSLTLDRTGFQPLTSSGRGIDDRSYAIGRVSGMVVAALVAVYVVMRSRRRRAAGR